jgi:hypothetical protein
MKISRFCITTVRDVYRNNYRIKQRRNRSRQKGIKNMLLFTKGVQRGLIGKTAVQ